MERDFTDRYIDAMQKCLDGVVKEVLKAILLREPHVEDYKKATLYRQEGDFSGWFLAYEKKKLGRIQERKTEGMVSGYDFTPCENKDLFEQSEIDGKVTF